MRRIIIAAAALMAATPALAADPVEGDWIVQGGGAKVRVGPCAANAALMCGRIVWLKQPNGPDGKPDRDDGNPDPKLKTRPIMGLPLVWDFRKAAPGRWTGGRIYDPRSGKTYGSKMSLNPDGTLKVDGCISVVCQGQTWKRS